MKETTRSAVVVLHHSVSGAISRLAETIADQFRPFADVTVADIVDADPADLAHADLIVVGVPTELLRILPRASKPAHFAAFSTRTMNAPESLTGSTAESIDHETRAAGYLPLTPPREFVIDDAGQMVDGQAAAAAEWGTLLAGRLNLHRERQLAE
ncbi:hypothetical protein ACEXQD_04375 [Herbiconiux sp. P15]|uniref:hypothetical protein n=1 Tax=Herbiconiux liukaitaii TaxID=3342799 RepID=UPI0035B6E405